MALNNSGRTLCVYTGKRPEIVDDNCVYYSDTTNRDFINSKAFSYFDTDSGLATINNVVFTHEPVIDLFSSATDDQVKSYFDSKLRDINSASVKYYDVNNQDLPVFKSFTINKTQLNQVINNISKFVEFERGETYIDYVVEINSDYSIGCSVNNQPSNIIEFYIISNERGSGKCIEIREICRKMSDDENVYFTTNYETLTPFSEAQQESTWKNAQLSIGNVRTISSRNIQGFDYIGAP